MSGTISGGVIKFERRIKTGEFEHKHAAAEISFTAEEGGDPTIITKDPDLHLTEFYEWEDRNPAFEAISYTALPVNHCRIQVFGFRFVTEALDNAKILSIQNGNLQCTYVVASGFSGKP